MSQWLTIQFRLHQRLLGEKTTDIRRGNKCGNEVLLSTINLIKTILWIHFMADEVSAITIGTNPLKFHAYLTKYQ